MTAYKHLKVKKTDGVARITLARPKHNVLDIEMMLMARPGTTIEDLTTLASHPVASAQCRGFLRAKLPDLPVEIASSTAEAARLAAETPGMAAIGPAIAGEQYGLDTLVANIADHPDNQTRFRRRPA